MVFGFIYSPAIASVKASSRFIVIIRAKRVVHFLTLASIILYCDIF